jgi:hypothetical protein
LADDGTYQRTNDGKTLVWNNYPTSGETAEWSGKQDKEGYATGYGTLTWHKVERSKFIFSKKHDVAGGRYSGKMIKGKFDGPVVSVDKEGKKTHATFVSGNRTSGWLEGSASTPERRPVVDAPAEGPSAIPVPPTKPDLPPPVKETAAPVDDSLRSVAAPPSTLRSNTLANPSPQVSTPPTTTSSLSTDVPRLTTPEVISLADGEARASGYNLSEYQNPRTLYNVGDETWSISYDQKAGGGAGAAGKNFSVTVEDKTKRTFVVTPK